MARPLDVLLDVADPQAVPSHHSDLEHSDNSYIQPDSFQNTFFKGDLFYEAAKLKKNGFKYNPREIIGHCRQKQPQLDEMSNISKGVLRVEMRNSFK